MLNRRHRSAAPLLLALVAGIGAGCSVDPAPEDLDGLTRWFWINYEAAADDAMLDGVQRLHDAIGSGIEDPLMVSISRLQPGDAEAAGLEEEADLEKAAGMLLVNVVRCPLDRIERMLVSERQKELHGGFDEFSRSYQTDLDAYLARSTPRLRWESAYTLSVFGSKYSAVLPGGSRFVKKRDADLGPAVIARAYLTQPARFDEGSSDYFRQDYQVQVFYERSPGEVLHLYAVWRESRLVGFDSEGDVLVSTTLSTFRDAGRNYEKHCEEWSHPG